MKRQTIQKQIILEAFSSLHDHPTAEQVYDRIHGEYPSVSKSTVYRVLQQAAGEKEIVRVEVPGGPDRYDQRTRPHYHIRCIRCGRMDDVKMKEAIDPVGLLQDACGYSAVDCNVLFAGICRACAGSQPDPGSHDR